MNLTRLRGLSALLLAPCFLITQITAEEPAPTPKVDYVVLHTVGKADAKLLKRLRGSIERHALLDVKLGDPVAPAGTKLEQQADSFKGQADPKATVNLLISEEHGRDPAHAHVDLTNHIAVVNLQALKSDKEEVYFRRVERQMVRAIGYSLQLKPCPNPQCGLFPYKNMKQLDIIGRSFCPPCQMFLRHAGKNQKITFRERVPDMKKDRAPLTPVRPKGPAPAPRK